MRICPTTLNWNSVEWNPMNLPGLDSRLESVRMNWLWQRHAPSLSLRDRDKLQKVAAVGMQPKLSALGIWPKSTSHGLWPKLLSDLWPKSIHKVWNVWTFSNLSDIKCFRLGHLWIAGVFRNDPQALLCRVRTQHDPLLANHAMQRLTLNKSKTCIHNIWS